MNDTLKTWWLTLKSQVFPFVLLCVAVSVLWFNLPFVEGWVLQQFTEWQHEYERRLQAETVIVALDESIVDNLKERFETRSVNDEFYHALIEDLRKLEVTNIVVSPYMQTHHEENSATLKEEKKLYLTQRYTLEQIPVLEKGIYQEEAGVHRLNIRSRWESGTEPYQFPLYYNYINQFEGGDEVLFPSLALSGVLQYYNSQNTLSKASWLTKAHHSFMHNGHELMITPNQFKPGDTSSIYTDKRGNILLRWAKKQSFYYGSAYSTREVVMLSEIYKDPNLDALTKVKGRPIVLADLTVSGLRTQPSVLHPRHLEADVIATAMDNIIQGQNLYSAPPWQVWLILTVVFLLCFITRVSRKNPVLGILVTILVASLYLILSFAVPLLTGVLYPFASPIAMALIALVMGEFYWKIRDDKDLRTLELNMTQLVSKSVLKEIQTKKTRLEAGGKRVQITSMFIDIRNFTKLSENLPPMEVTEILNAWYTEVERIVNEYRGTVDKFLGDGALAMFGAPVETSQHANMALKAARHLIESSHEMASKWKQERDIDFSVGISMNSGYAFVGFIGPQNKLEYTAIGDTVNTSSRLQDQTKIFHTQIIFSESTLKQCLNINLGGEIAPLGDVKVRGKEQQISLYTFSDMFVDGYNTQTAVEAALERMASDAMYEMGRLPQLNPVGPDAIPVHEETAEKTAPPAIRREALSPMVEVHGEAPEETEVQDDWGREAHQAGSSPPPLNTAAPQAAERNPKPPPPAEKPVGPLASSTTGLLQPLASPFARPALKGLGTFNGLKQAAKPPAALGEFPKKAIPKPATPNPFQKKPPEKTDT